MVTQSTTYSLPPADVKALIASKISIFDKYIILNTDVNEYTALIYNPPTQKTTKYVVSRLGLNYSNTWNIIRIDDVEFDYNYSNEYYIVSNDGIGQMMDLPVYEPLNAICSGVLLAICFFAIVFKGVLFKCLRKK